MLGVLGFTPLMIGCGAPTYSVQGKVAYEDGSPFREGTVAFRKEGQDQTFEGAVDEGAFEIGGLPAGKYLVVVRERETTPEEGDAPPRVHPKFASWETSNITCEVLADVTSFEIQIRKPNR